MHNVIAPPRHFLAVVDADTEEELQRVELIGSAKTTAAVTSRDIHIPAGSVLRLVIERPFDDPLT